LAANGAGVWSAIGVVTTISADGVGEASVGAGVSAVCPLSVGAGCWFDEPDPDEGRRVVAGCDVGAGVTGARVGAGVAGFGVGWMHQVSGRPGS
jgi:hypothetical protein